VNNDASDFWTRARQALITANALRSQDPDAAASRAYYAAFYAVSAHFAGQGKFFTKHSGIETAVHRDLVRCGFLSADLGAGYSSLVNLRTAGDYGGGAHVSEQDAQMACETAACIVAAIAKINPDF
jgi:hypothetical protein